MNRFQNRRAKEKRLQKDVLKTQKEEHSGSYQAITHPNIAENQTFVHRSANFLGKKNILRHQRHCLQPQRQSRYQLTTL